MKDDPCTPPKSDILPGNADIPRNGTDLATLSSSVALLSTDAPMSLMLDVQGRLEHMQRAIRKLKASLDARLIEWIEANGPIVVGTRRIYVGQKSETKCGDLRAAIEALLEDCNGDMDMVCRCLSVNAIKSGAAKIAMTPEHYREHFTVVTRTELREGVETPVKQLVDIDERFAR